jgi:hypothetical protein
MLARLAPSRARTPKPHPAGKRMVFASTGSHQRNGSITIEIDRSVSQHDRVGIHDLYVYA